MVIIMSKTLRERISRQAFFSKANAKDHAVGRLQTGRFDIKQVLD